MSTSGDLQHQYFDMLMDSQWWSADQLRSYQRSQLNQLLRHAKANVPFYSERLDGVFKPDGEINWDRWGELPLVTRKDMSVHREAMQARQLPPGHGPTAVLHTSGSTGLPIDITTTALAVVADNGFRWRVHRWHDLDWSKVLVSRLGVAADSEWFGGARALGPWGPPWDERSALGAAWTMDRDLANTHVAEIYERLEATYLNAGAASSHVLARDAQRHGTQLRIDAILTQGNTVRATDRAICRRVFGARMIETYSSKEGGQLAHECPLGSLHLNMEGSLLEVINDEGRPCAPGETGRVVITPIFQTGQPLIRYLQGDLATVGADCPCGRHSLVLERVVGRSVSVFSHPSGSARVVTLLDDAVREHLRSAHLQLAQIGPVTFEARYQPLSPHQASDEIAAAEAIRASLWADSQIVFRRRDTAPTFTDKIIEFVNEWDGDILETS